MELTVQNVYGLLLRSKLLPVDDARAMFARWQAEAKDGAQNAGRFAAWMVQHKYVTSYQATLLARGHADGFFLNDYKILDRRGKGRMAGVYKAQHQLGQVVAIKVLPPSKAREPNMLSRFQREAKLAMRLKHPNIVRTFQVGVAGDVHYLVMEYLEGETLDEALARRGKLPPAEAVRLVYQALLGLQHIHQQGLVHRDLKPANMMLVAGPGANYESTLRWTVKILDIGLGRALFEDQPLDSMQQFEDGQITGEGVILGTPDYMSPEQARDARAADIRSDIYSLGCVLYHLLAGQPPFPDTNIISQMIRHASEQARPLVELNPSVPDGLQQIVNWMMAKDPAQRYPTPERAAQALQVFLTAGSDFTATPIDESMSRYLIWLDQHQRLESPADAKPAPSPAALAAMPATVVIDPPPPSGIRRSNNPAKESPSGKLGTRKVKRPPPAPLSPAAETQPGGGSNPADVELIALAPTDSPLQLPYGFTVSRRELAAFALGAAAGGGVTLVGCLLALGRRTPRAPTAPEPTEPTTTPSEDG